MKLIYSFLCFLIVTQTISELLGGPSDPDPVNEPPEIDTYMSDIAEEQFLNEETLSVQDRLTQLTSCANELYAAPNAGAQTPVNWRFVATQTSSRFMTRGTTMTQLNFNAVSVIKIYFH